jgi:site-specific DNA-methyltransferase (adenine-specific)
MRRQLKVSATSPAATPTIDNASQIVPIDSIKPWDKNPRKNDRAVNKVAKSIKQFGFNAPIIVCRATNEIIAGHTRYKAARKLGLASVPVRFIDLPLEQAHAYALADNRTAEEAEWDNELLGSILDELRNDGAEYFDAIGFDREELIRLLTPLPEESTPEPTPNLVERYQVELGQRWVIHGTAGDHVVVCGDSTNPQHVAQCAGGEQFDFVFTSPPYNVGVQYASHSDIHLPWEQYSQLLRQTIEAFMPYLANGRIVAWNIGTAPRVFPHRQAVLLEECGLTYNRQIVWIKNGASMPLWYVNKRRIGARFFTPNMKHELILLYSKGEVAYGGDITIIEELRDDVISCEASNSTKELPSSSAQNITGASHIRHREVTRAAHPAPFPVKLPWMFANMLSDIGTVVFDPFVGSGTTILACEKANRRGYGIDIAPEYVALTLERMVRNGCTVECVA